jgi:membrane-associated phospholipid phosphatase
MMSRGSPVKFTVWRRLLWLFMILIAIALYFPINRLAHNGVQLILPIDRAIPLYPPAVVPYLLADVLFIGFPIWAALRIKPQEFEAYTVSILLAILVSYIVYLTLPTAVSRPEVTSTDFFSSVISRLYQVDQSYNAAPSGHTYYTIISFLYLSRWKPKFKLVWGIIAALILLSTLFTRQHYVLDIVAGLALAILAYAVGRLAQNRWNLKFAS